mgnify:CR=1 FL=1
MERLENELFQSDHPLFALIVLWRRYIDDIFCIWTGSEQALHQLLEVLNGLYPSIQFTIEAGGATLNFHDLKISTQQQMYAFKIYRKPANPDITIHGESHCPLPHELAVNN